MGNLELKECIEYFKKNNAYDRVFKKIRSKYMSLGKFSGNITLEKPSVDEKHTLSGFMKKDYYKTKTININLEKFKENFKNSRFEKLDIEDVLNEYFNETILSNKELKQIVIDDRKKYFYDILKNFENTPSYYFFENAISKKNNIYKMLLDNYNKNKEELRESIIYVCLAINNLPNKKTLISIFATKIANQPHRFDVGTLEYKLIIEMLKYINKDIDTDTDSNIKIKINNLEEKVNLLYKHNLLVDDLSNFIVTYGLLGYTNLKIHKGMQMYFENNEPLMLNLQNLSNLDIVEGINKKVFVLENPSVFSNIYNYFKEKEIKVSLICTYGQIKLSGYVILDLLKNSNNMIYYSGDIDPEGIQIADKLKSKYKENLKFIMFDEKIYLKNIVNENSKKHLNKLRLSKLNKISSNELQNISKNVLEYKKAVYQEQFIDDLIRYVENILEKQ